MSRDGSWGDHFTLFGACEVFCANIWILSSVKGPDSQAVTLIQPRACKSDLTVRLLNYHENHFDALKPKL